MWSSPQYPLNPTMGTVLPGGDIPFPALVGPCEVDFGMETLPGEDPPFNPTMGTILPGGDPPLGIQLCLDGRVIENQAAKLRLGRFYINSIFMIDPIRNFTQNLNYLFLC